jgi:hypothetical protein
MSADNDKPDSRPGKTIVFALDPKTNKKVKVELQGRDPATQIAKGINLETGQPVVVQFGRDPATGVIQH